MFKTKILILKIFAILFCLFYLSGVVYAAGVTIDASPSAGFLTPGVIKIDDDVTITARDQNRGLNYAGYTLVCWRINNVTITGCTTFTDIEHLTANLNNQYISDIEPGEYHYEVVLRRPGEGYDSIASKRFTVGDNTNTRSGANQNTNNIIVDDPLEFGEAEIGSSTLSRQDFNVTNNSGGEVTITYTLSGDNSFSIGQSNTITRSIPSDNIDAETIVFNPATEGLKQATLNVVVASAGGQELVNQNVSITGTGALAQAADSADDSATSTSDGSGDMGGGASDGSGGGGGTVLNCFPNPLKFFRCDDDQATAMTVNDLVRNIINGIFGLLGAIAVGIIVYGGVLYMTAGASKDGTEKAKKIITSAAIGLIIALLSLAIVDLLFVLLGGR